MPQHHCANKSVLFRIARSTLFVPLPTLHPLKSESQGLLLQTQARPRIFRYVLLSFMLVLGHKPNDWPQ